MKISWRVISTLILLAVPLLSCKTPQKDEIRIGINLWPGYEFLYLAKQKRLYPEDKLKFRLLPFNSLGDARRAYEQGQINGIMCTLIEVLQIRENSELSPTVAWATDFSSGSDVVVARNEIRDLADLKGKKVAAEIGSLGVYMLARSLDFAKLILKDITLVAMDQQDMSAALQSGQVDAAISYPPVSIEMLNSGKGHVLFSSDKIPGEVVDVVAFEQRLIDDRPEEILELLKAFNAGIEYAKKFPDESYEIMAKREGLSKEEFIEALSGIHVLTACEMKALFRPDGQLQRAIKTTDSIMRTLNQIRGADYTTKIATSEIVEKFDGCGSAQAETSKDTKS